jgi:hypothetical protein
LVKVQLIEAPASRETVTSSSPVSPPGEHDTATTQPPTVVSLTV